MNLLLGITIYYALLGINNFRSEPFPVFGTYQFAFGSQQNRITVINVIPDSPAAKAGVHPTDIIIRFKINGTNEWRQIESAKHLIASVQQGEGKSVMLEVENIRNGEKRMLEMVPQYDQKEKRALIGVQLADIVILSYEKPLEKALAGFAHSYNVLDYNFRTIGMFVASAFKAKTVEPVSQVVSGPVGIWKAVDETVQSSGKKILINLLNLTGLLSLSLAFMNIIPFPALDGGRLVFIIYEWLTKKQPNAKFEQVVNTIGILFLLSMALLITISDIMKLWR
jgi:regulator of sigma E protease